MCWSAWMMIIIMRWSDCIMMIMIIMYWSDQWTKIMRIMIMCWSDCIMMMMMMMCRSDWVMMSNDVNNEEEAKDESEVNEGTSKG